MSEDPIRDSYNRILNHLIASIIVYFNVQLIESFGITIPFLQ